MDDRIRLAYASQAETPRRKTFTVTIHAEPGDPCWSDRNTAAASSCSRAIVLIALAATQSGATTLIDCQPQHRPAGGWVQDMANGACRRAGKIPFIVAAGRECAAGKSNARDGVFRARADAGFRLTRRAVGRQAQHAQIAAEVDDAAGCAVAFKRGSGAVSRVPCRSRRNRVPCPRPAAQLIPPFVARAPADLRHSLGKPHRRLARTRRGSPTRRNTPEVMSNRPLLSA